MSDLIKRAKAANNAYASACRMQGSAPPRDGCSDCFTSQAEFQFLREAEDLVPELISEVERLEALLRQAGKL